MSPYLTGFNSDKSRALHPFLIIISIMLSLPVFAQQCDSSQPETTPDRLFIMNDNGTVKDKNTNLLWMRCALGQNWREGHCAFSHMTYDFLDAADAARQLNKEGGFAGYKDWRLPTLKELSTIIEKRCNNPAINIKAFPDTPVTAYWSSTKDPAYSDGAMLVHLLPGLSYMGNKRVPWAVRLVRHAR